MPRRASTIPHKMLAIDVARCFQVSPSTVTSWPCPRNEDGTYDMREVITFDRDRVKASCGMVTNEKSSIDMRMKIAKTRREEILTERLAGDSIPLADAKRELHTALIHFKNTLMKTPGAIAPKLEGRTKEEIYDILLDVMRNALETMRHVDFDNVVEEVKAPNKKRLDKKYNMRPKSPRQKTATGRGGAKGKGTRKK